MLPRATDQTRQALIEAQAQAREYAHPYVGTEHIACGLLAVDDRLASVFAECGASSTRCLETLVTFVDRDDERPVYVPFTTGAKQALQQADDGGHDVTPSMLMAVLLSDPESGASSLLYSLGTDISAIMATIVERPRITSSLADAVAALEQDAAGIEQERSAWHAEREDLLAQCESMSVACTTAQTNAKQLQAIFDKITAAIETHRLRAGEHVSVVDTDLYRVYEEVKHVFSERPHTN